MPRMKVAAVTGSNGGFGPEVVRTLREAGWAAVSNGRSARKGPGDLHVRADVSTPAGAARLVRETRKRFGRLDLLVCGVGDFRPTPVSHFDLASWEDLFDSNLRSAWLCAKAALPELRRRRGAVVTFGGPVTHHARGNPRYAAYQMAKTALTVFTKSLAHAEAPRGVRVNMINPGFIRTAACSEKDAREMARKVPARRLGSPRDIAEAVLWLAGPAAGYVNGAVLDVGGGLWT
jgi:3-oxoacyl-[acyl-carrier protein] reductase